MKKHTNSFFYVVRDFRMLMYSFVLPRLSHPHFHHLHGLSPRISTSIRTAVRHVFQISVTFLSLAYLTTPLLALTSARHLHSLFFSHVPCDKLITIHGTMIPTDMGVTDFVIKPPRELEGGDSGLCGTQ